TNRKVLITGGALNSVGLNNSELYDPSTGNWTTVNKMNYAGFADTASVLLNGKVLISGGIMNGFLGVHRAELYDPLTEDWIETA
ncbi:unnamed protein product, partial [Rotaria sp. Silwood1]